MIYLLNDKKFKDAKNLPVILTKFLDKKIDLSSYEALIFSSKNGVYAIDRLDSRWKNIPAYSIGSGTSKVIKELKGKLFFSANSSYGDDFANEIKERLFKKRALFLRAKVVTSNLNTILKENGVLLDEEIVYETICNSCKNLKKPPKNSIIIFSSPSTIECFFKCFDWDKSYKAVAIGKNTASYLPKDITYKISNEQNLSSCIKLAKEIQINF